VPHARLQLAGGLSLASWTARGDDVSPSTLCGVSISSKAEMLCTTAGSSSTTRTVEGLSWDVIRLLDT
jgi:hypothetical protein